MIGSNIAIHGNGATEFGKYDDRHVMPISDSIEKSGEVRRDVSNVVIQIPRHVVRIEIRLRCQLVGMSIVSSVGLHIERFSNSAVQKGF